jgi:hypothetical protein
MTATATFHEVALFNFQLTRTGLRPLRETKPPSRQDWELLGDYLSWMEGSLEWLIGDWVTYGESHFADKAAQVIDATGWDLNTVKQKARVSQQVPPARRDPDLTWSHHREVADLKPAEQEKALAKAKREEMSVAELRHHLRKSGATEATCWLVVSCKSETDREKLQKRLELEGRACKIP